MHWVLIFVLPLQILSRSFCFPFYQLLCLFSSHKSLFVLCKYSWKWGISLNYVKLIRGYSFRENWHFLSQQLSIANNYLFRGETSCSTLSLWWYLIWFGLGQVVNMLLSVLWIHMYICPDVHRRYICFFFVVIHYFWLILFLILLIQMSLSLWTWEVIPMFHYGCILSSCLCWWSSTTNRCFSDKGWEVHLSMDVIMDH